ncbi:MAG: DUF6364 family protein [Bacteroidales bacterium]
MDKKLTLSLDQKVIEQAKIYSKTNKISLSKLIESYLSTVTKRENDASKITPLVESLSGVINFPDDLDIKDSYSDYLIEKYK